MAAVTYTGTRNLAGDVLGPNLISNGHFTDNTTGWAGVNATLSKTADGKLRVTSTSSSAAAIAQGPVTLESGALYRVDLDFTLGTAASGLSYSETGGTLQTGVGMASSGSYSYYFVATATDGEVWLYSNTGAAAIGLYNDYDNVKVRKVIARGHATDIEHVTNGAFIRDAQWTKGAGWAIGSGVATATAGSASTLKNALGLGLRYGKTYDTSITIGGTPASFIALYLGDFVGADEGTQRSTGGTFTEQLIAGVDSSGNSNIIIGKSPTGAGTVDNVSVKLAADNTWTLDLSIQKNTYQQERRPSFDRVYSLDKSAAVTTYDGAETYHSFTTTIQDYQAYPFIDEWLASVEDGTSFTFDLFGTSTQPDNPVSMILETYSRQPAMTVGGNRAYRYQVTLREV